MRDKQTDELVVVKYIERGEKILPQAVCSRHGLAIGAAVTPVVRVLVCICFPVAYPISKLLDLLLGKEHEALFRRAELKTLVDFHGNEVLQWFSASQILCLMMDIEEVIHQEKLYLKGFERGSERKL